MGDNVTGLRERPPPMSVCAARQQITKETRPGFTDFSGMLFLIYRWHDIRLCCLAVWFIITGSLPINSPPRPFFNISPPCDFAEGHLRDFAAHSVSDVRVLPWTVDALCVIY